jgi:hypothetical protein
VKRIIALVLAAVIILAAANADAQVYFKAPVEFAGTGCQPSSYRFSGEGTDTLSILFSAYDAANPQENASSKLQRAACSFAVPIHVPTGCQISVMTADWRGYAKGATELFREYFFAGREGISKTSNPSGDFTERDDNLKHETFSAYGEDMILRINSSVRAIDNDSYIVVDTVDLQNTLVLHLATVKCGSLPLPAILNLLL